MGRNNSDFHEARSIPGDINEEAKRSPVFTTNSSGTTSINSNEVTRRVANYDRYRHARKTAQEKRK